MSKEKDKSRAETYLNRIRNIGKELRDKRNELDALRYKASGAGAIRYDKDHVQTSAQDFLSMAMDDIIRIDKEIEEKEACIEDMKGQAYTIVRTLTVTDHRTLIDWYYLNGLTMTDTADKMHISERTAYYLRDDALIEFGRSMKL